MFFSKCERMLSWRYIRSRKSEGFLSVIVLFALMGIMLGVGTLIVVMAVMNGFRSELMGKILGMSGHISVHKAQGALEDYDILRGALEQLPYVEHVVPVIDGQVIVSSGASNRGAVVRGMRLSDLLSQKTFSNNIVAGSLDNFIEGRHIIMGERLAHALGVSYGDDVTLISPDVTATLFGGVPRSQRFTVAALFSVGMYQYDSGFVFLSLTTAQSFLQWGNRVGVLELTIEDPVRIEPTLSALEPVAREQRLHYSDWRMRNREFFNALKVERNVMFLILTLIILVAVFNIISGLILLVKDKEADIAVLRGMGATKGMLMRVFFLSGSIIGLIGTLLGGVLGVLFVENIKAIQGFIENLLNVELFSEEIYFLSSVPAEIEWFEVVLVVSMSLFFSFVATLYPAWRAARIDPVEVLCYG
ncbi:MAG: lipoprotein-releasing ABC transporter permease subunit [Alphaproteobacteria bacterium GM7ARS4]|nr:lipoprotein-releasing ABC transporter permease subunit [Alphaproteobacteria bacterium GM7ARS4]